MGIESTLPNSADNRRSLNNTAFTVANWRDSAPTTAKAQITGPQPGSTLISSTVTFSWNTGSGVTQYWLDVGTTLGGTQIYSQSQGASHVGDGWRAADEWEHGVRETLVPDRRHVAVQ